MIETTENVRLDAYLHPSEFQQVDEVDGMIWTEDLIKFEREQSEIAVRDFLGSLSETGAVVPHQDVSGSPSPFHHAAPQLATPHPDASGSPSSLPCVLSHLSTPTPPIPLADALANHLAVPQLPTLYPLIPSTDLLNNHQPATDPASDSKFLEAYVLLSAHNDIAIQYWRVYSLHQAKKPKHVMTFTEAYTMSFWCNRVIVEVNMRWEREKNCERVFVMSANGT